MFEKTKINEKEAEMGPFLKDSFTCNAGAAIHLDHLSFPGQVSVLHVFADAQFLDSANLTEDWERLLSYDSKIPIRRHLWIDRECTKKSKKCYSSSFLQ